MYIARRKLEFYLFTVLAWVSVVPIVGLMLVMITILQSKLALPTTSTTTGLLPFLGEKVSLTSQAIKSQIQINIKDFGTSIAKADDSKNFQPIFSRFSPDGKTFLQIIKHFPNNNSRPAFKSIEYSASDLFKSSTSTSACVYFDQNNRKMLFQAQFDSKDMYWGPVESEPIKLEITPKSKLDDPTVFVWDCPTYFARTQQLAIHFRQDFGVLDLIGLWDTSTGRFLRTISTHQFDELAFTPDGEYLMALSKETDKIKFFPVDLQNSELTQNNNGLVRNWVFDSKQNVLITVGDFETVRTENFFDPNMANPKQLIKFWDLNNLKLKRQIGVLDREKIQTLLYLPDKKLLITQGEFGSIYFIDVQTQNIVKTLQPNQSKPGQKYYQANTIDLRPDRGMLVAFNLYGGVDIWSNININ
jgi:WD40 repeat protein